MKATTKEKQRNKPKLKRIVDKTKIKQKLISFKLLKCYNKEKRRGCNENT